MAVGSAFAIGMGDLVAGCYSNCTMPEYVKASSLIKSPKLPQCILCIV